MFHRLLEQSLRHRVREPVRAWRLCRSRGAHVTSQSLPVVLAEFHTVALARGTSGRRSTSRICLTAVPHRGPSAVLQAMPALCGLPASFSASTSRRYDAEASAGAAAYDGNTGGKRSTRPVCIHCRRCLRRRVLVDAPGPVIGESPRSGSSSLVRYATTAGVVCGPQALHLYQDAEHLLSDCCF